MHRFFDDFRFGIRLWIKSGGTTVIALVALTLGIGLPTLMFSVVNGILFAPLPFEEPDRIVYMDRAGRAEVTPEDFLLWSERQSSFEGVGAATLLAANLSVDGFGAVPVFGSALTASTFATLRVQPILGRPFAEADDRPGAAPVALLGHELWTRNYAADPGIIGRTVRVNGESAVVVGVMPPGFGFPLNAQLWLPLRLDPLRPALRPGCVGEGCLLLVFGRLRQGVSAEAAARQLSDLTRQSDSDRGLVIDESSNVVVDDFTKRITGADSITAAIFVMGAVFLVLLIACANIANILAARALTRRREAAVRAALGASRGQMLGQFLIEVLVLGIAGGIGGTLLAIAGMRVITSVVDLSQQLFWAKLELDVRVLAFVVASTLAAALAAGLLPAIQASRSDPSTLLKDGGRGSSGLRIGRGMRSLVIVELALTVLLLAAAGLVVRSTLNLYSLDLGFDGDRIYHARLRLPDVGYPTGEDQVLFAQGLQSVVGSVPGITEVAFASTSPGLTPNDRPFVVEGEVAGTDRDPPHTRPIVVSPGFFDAFGAPITAGRDFDGQDQLGSPPVVIVNATFERRHMPEGAVGRRVRFTDQEGDEEWRTIIGVAPDLLAGGITNPAQDAVYLPLSQRPLREFSILARSPGDGSTLLAPIQRALADYDPDVLLVQAGTLREAIIDANPQYVWLGSMFLAFGAAALFLGTLGLYGVVAFWVEQRQFEMGVRLALGARAGDVLRLVLGAGMRQTGLGLAVGVLLALPSMLLLRAGLIDVSPHDPLVFGVVVVVLLGGTWLGCWMPARRAIRIDPMEILKES